MNKIEFSTIGSGTVPHVLEGPAHSLTRDQYPIAHSKSDLRTRSGDAVVVINPEDFSVSVGLRTATISVGASALPLPANPLEFRRALVVHNNGSADVFLGDSTVTAGDGLPLAAGEKIAFDIQGNPNVEVYAISGGGTIDVRIMELA